MLFWGILNTMYPYLIENDDTEKNGIQLAEIPVFERCRKYGTSPQKSSIRTSEQPEMTVGINMYA